MTVKFPPALFVTGTDTDVGKTFVCALLMLGLGARYWKPVQSGAVEGTDTDWLRRITGLPENRFCSESYRLDAYLAPHAAAARQGIRIGLESIRMPSPAAAGGAPLIIEGAGGLMVPLNEGETMADLILQLDAPVLLVARSGLGTLNHTLLSLEKLRHMGANVWGVVMNGPENRENRDTIERFGNIRVRAQIPPLADVTPRGLEALFHTCFGAPDGTGGRHGGGS